MREVCVFEDCCVFVLSFLQHLSVLCGDVVNVADVEAVSLRPTLRRRLLW